MQETEQEQVIEIKGSVTKNTSYLTMALVLQKVISLTYFALLARNLGPDYLGNYYFAISFATIFGIVIDLGLTNVLTREVAKKQKKAKHILGTVLAIKLPLLLIASLILFIFIKVKGLDTLTTTLVYISFTCVTLDSFTATFWAVVRGFHNLLFESISAILFQVIVASVGLYFMYSGFSLVYIMSALLAASTFHFIYSSIILNRKMKVSIVPVFDKDLIIKMLKITAPFALFAVFQRFYMYFDTVLLKFLAGDNYVGYYQVPFKIIFALQFLPMAFVASLYPAMSHYWLTNRKQLVIAFEKALVYLMVVSLPITAGVIAIADKIIMILQEGKDHDYLPAILPMQIIILAVLFIFINFPIGSLLNACDKQKKNSFNMFIATILSVSMNFILIPRLQTVGASITVVATNLLMCIIGFHFVLQTIKFDVKKITLAFFKILISAILMGVVVYSLKEKMHILFVIPIGALIYFVLLFVFKTVRKDEIIHVCKSFLKR